MKKVIGRLIALFIIVFINFSYVEGAYDVCGTDPTEECCCDHPGSNICQALQYDCGSTTTTTTTSTSTTSTTTDDSSAPEAGGDEPNPSDCPAANIYYDIDGNLLCCQYEVENGACPECPSSRIYQINNETFCCPGTVVDGKCNNNLGDMGIKLDPDCLLNGQCSLNVYKVMGIRQSDPNPTVLSLFQDITLASTTVALGSVIVIAMVIGGLSRAFASLTGKDTKKGKDIVIKSFIGMLLVLGSYAIVRFVQFLATAGS